MTWSSSVVVMVKLLESDDGLARDAGVLEPAEGPGGLVERVGRGEEGANRAALDQRGDLAELRAAGMHEQELVPHAELLGPPPDASAQGRHHPAQHRVEAQF